MSMTPLQACFVEEYLKDVNAKEAAIQAGYSPKTAKQKGHTLLQIPKIRDAILAAMEARSKRTAIEQDKVIRGLLDEAEFKSEGTSHGARVAAWAHLGKHLGMFTDNLNVKGGGPVTFIMKLHDEE